MVLFGPDRDLAARSLWSYRRHAPAASIVAACVDGATPTLERTASRDRIDLIDLPETRQSAWWSEHPYMAAALARFIDVPRLLPPADLYLMVDADALCLRPPPVEALFRVMTAGGAIVAAAPEVNATVGQPYLTRCRKIFDAFYLPQMAIDQRVTMVNSGVVAWRHDRQAPSFRDEFAACLQYIEEADATDALFLLPWADQAILNVLAQRHAGGRFHMLDPAWNERRTFERDSTSGPAPAHEDAIIWHCRASFEALWAAYYPEQAIASTRPGAVNHLDR
jgi:hypothetical protein